MTGRIDADGRAVLDGILPEDLTVLLSALDCEVAHQGSAATRCELEARDRRDLAATQRRGRHANLRVAGELEAEARGHTDRQMAALDVIRTLRPLIRESKSQLDDESQKGPHATP